MSAKNLKKIIFLLLLLNALVWWTAAHENRRGVLTVVFLDIGQGDATLIETPRGRQILIDGGPSLKVLERLGRVLPFYDRSLDLVVATHPDADHITGLPEVLERYRVGGLILSPAHWVDPTARSLLSTAKVRNVPIIYGAEDWTINLGEGIKAQIISPPYSARLTADDNDTSIVIRLTYGQTTFLFTGDASGKVERRLVASDRALRTEVLKVGHHGSKNSSDATFLKLVGPTYAVISAGAGNRYGHPAPETLKRLESTHARLLRTDLLGTIIIQSDGKNLHLVKGQTSLTPS